MYKYWIIGLVLSLLILTACSQSGQRAEDIRRRIILDGDLSESDKALLSSKISNDPEICNKVDERDKTQCLMNVYTNIAVEKNDSTACNNLEPSFRFGCVTNVAIALKDQELCDSIGQDSSQYRCKELIVKQIAIDGNDASICDEFEFQGNKYLEAWVPRARCIEQAAFCNMNEDLCENSGCKEVVRQIKAIGNTDTYICDLRQSI